MSINWTNIYNKHKGLWVALKDDEVTVISAAKTPKETLKIAKQKGYNDPILAKIPKEMTQFVGNV